MNRRALLLNASALVASSVPLRLAVTQPSELTYIQSQRVEVDGLSIAYRQSGRGPVLLLLHGFLADSRCWRRQLSDLSKNFTLVAWDAPGAGLSTDPPNTFTTTNYVQCLEGFLNQVGIDRAHILGLSWGGILAQEFYRLHADRISTLVLANTYAGWRGSLDESAWRDRLATCLRLADGPAGAVISELVPGMFTDTVRHEVREELSDIVSDFHPVGFRLMALSCAEVDTRDLLPKINVPTLVISGDGDRRSPMHIANQLHSLIPNSQLATIQRAGHVSNMEQPEEFNREVDEFCSLNS